MRRLRWLGHATVLLELGQTRLLTDPVLRGRLAHLRRHTPAESPPTGVDAVLISHVHHDHLDRGSLRQLGRPSTAIVVPAGAEKLVRGLGFGVVHSVLPGDEIELAGTRVRVVPAWHPSQRGPRGKVIPAVGYVADRIWFAGDTDLHPEMASLADEVDVALLPVWGWGPSLGPGHMDPSQAAEAAALVHPAHAIPIHWGTFLPFGLGWRYGHLLTDPPHEFARQVAARCPSTEVTVLAPGGTWSA